ncbi:MAG: DUF262 domain-containing protein [Acidobacteriota bacterium]|nr:DUF262 domain-containing protein [Acidobacteriota bacterium]
MEATPTQIINYFSGFKQNLVPLFQRPYTWGERQWRTLWEDVISFYGSDLSVKKSTHFMGAVVTMPARSVPVGISKFLVIDGQQRLTTIALLLCAIRDELSSSDLAPKRRIQNFYLTNDGYEGLDFFKLLPTQGDRLLFSPLIQNSGSAVPDSQFKKSYNFFRRRLKELDEEGQVIDSKQVLEIVESRLMVVMINLSDTDDPYLIFESLNFKGSPLEQADLVRNYFLMRFPVSEQQRVYDDLWLPMQNRLGPSLTEFMRHFLGSEGEEVRKGDVYAAIKRLVADSDAQSVRLLITRMEQLSVLYSRIAVLTHEPNEELEKFFLRFRRLDFGTVYPLLLSLYEDYLDGQFTIQDFIASLRILDSYIVRRTVVGVPSNSLSGVFISLCRSKPITETPSAWLSAELTRESKNRRWPADTEFSERWVKAPLYGSRACQVVLECLEEHFDHHETVSFAETSIEHVLPQTLTAEWQQTLGQAATSIQGEWLHTIGNLTITGYNPALSNKPYVEKRAIFGLSHFELNRFFADCENWDAAQIHRRAESLFAKALEIWPHPPVAADEPVTAQRVGPANFHLGCVRAAERHFGKVYSKVSQTRYEAGDQGMRLVCAVSGEHNESGGIPYFWFAVHQSQLDFLAAVPSAWLCFGCGSAKETLLVPVSVVQPFLPQMSVTTGEDRHYWHVVIQRKVAKLILRLLGANDGPDLTTFLVPYEDSSPVAT